MNKLQKIQSLVEKYTELVVFTDEKTKKNINKILKEICKEAYNLGIQSMQESHIGKDKHTMGIELESYVNTLEYRGFEEEAKKLLEIASKLK